MTNPNAKPGHEYWFIFFNINFSFLSCTLSSCCMCFKPKKGAPAGEETWEHHKLHPGFRPTLGAVHSLPFWAVMWPADRESSQPSLSCLMPPFHQSGPETVLSKSYLRGDSQPIWSEEILCEWIGRRSSTQYQDQGKGPYSNPESSPRWSTRFWLSHFCSKQYSASFGGPTVGSCQSICESILSTCVPSPSIHASANSLNPASALETVWLFPHHALYTTSQFVPFYRPCT